jgi:hypothetical protein
MLPRNRAASAAWSLQAVYDLAAKRRVGLRFNCKNLTSKCASLRFTCNRQELLGLPIPHRPLARPNLLILYIYGPLARVWSIHGIGVIADPFTAAGAKVRNRCVKLNIRMLVDRLGYG